MMRKISYFVIAMLVMTSMLLAACGGGEDATATPPPTKEKAEPAATPKPAPTEAPKTTEKVKIRWFVGLGTGSDPEQMPQEEALVKEFNASQDEIELVVEFVENSQAPDQLKTQVAAGDAPDIIGPVGQSGVNEFSGLFLDLEPYLKDFDWSDFDQDSIDAYRLEGEGLLGLLQPRPVRRGWSRLSASQVW